MKRAIIFILLIGLSLGLSAQKLVILHTNDSHSQIEGFRVGRDKGMAGVDRRLQLVDSVRSKYGENRVLLLDAGDYNQGTPYFTVAKGDLEIELMNALGYDVVSLGNHEFDNGIEELARRLSSANYPSLCCNYSFDGTAIESIIKPYTIVKRGGLKIGIVGATTYLEGSVLASNLAGVERLNTIDEVNKWASFLKNEKRCDMVILLSHLGFDRGSKDRPSDVVMAENSKDIDLIIGGHTHTFIDKPRMVKNLDGKEIMIVQAGCKGLQVGEIIVN